MDTFCDFQEIGDVVFVRAKNLDTRLITAGQTFLTGKRAIYSHVLLCVAPGLYLHAIPKSGVFFANTESPEMCFPNVYPQWSVRRNTQLSTAKRFELSQWAAYYIGQAYNFRLVGSTLSHTRYRRAHSYCSEVIAKVYRKLDCDLVITPSWLLQAYRALRHTVNAAKDHETADKAIPVEWVLPVDLDEATRSAPWVNVTEEYDRGLKALSPKDGSDLRPLQDYFRSIYLQQVKITLTQAKTAIEISNAANKLASITASLKRRRIESSDAGQVGFDYANALKQIRDLEKPEKLKTKMPELSFSQELGPTMPDFPSHAQIRESLRESFRQVQIIHYFQLCLLYGTKIETIAVMNAKPFPTLSNIATMRDIREKLDLVFSQINASSLDFDEQQIRDYINAKPEGDIRALAEELLVLVIQRMRLAAAAASEASFIEELEELVARLDPPNSSQAEA